MGYHGVQARASFFWKCVPLLHQMLKTYPASRPASHHHQQRHHDSSPITQHPSSIIIIIIIIIGQTPLQPDTAPDRHCFSYAPLRVVPARRRLGQPALQSCTGSVGHCFVRTRPRPTSRSDDACPRPFDVETEAPEGNNKRNFSSSVNRAGLSKSGQHEAQFRKARQRAHFNA